MIVREENPCGITIISQITSLNGLGGIGKSDMARKFAHTFAENFHNNVVWINAEKSDTCKTSFSALAKQLNIPTTDTSTQLQRDFDTILKEIYQVFYDKKFLFIFDNVDEYRNGSEGVYHFLPNSLPPNAIRPYILMTSRNCNLVDGVDTLALAVLSTTETSDFIRNPNSLGPTESDEDVRMLGELLQSLPLALPQAVAYIKKSRKRHNIFNKTYSIRDYCEEFEIRTKDILNFEYFNLTGDIYEKTVLLTWVITLVKINEEKYGADAIQIIRMISYFNPDNIPLNLFDTYLGSVKVEEAVILLIQYSMVDCGNAGTINIHRLVQQVVRIQIKDDALVERIWKSAVVLFEGYDKDDRLWGKWVPHAESLWNHAYQSENLINEFSQFPVKVCRRMKGKESLEFQRRIITKFESFLGKYHDDVLNLKFASGHCLLLNKDNAEAEIVFRDLYLIAKEHLGGRSILSREIGNITHAALSNLADCLECRGEIEESLKMMEELLSLLTKSCGREFNLDALQIIVRMSTLRMKTGRDLDKVYKDLKIVCETYEKNLGVTHINTLEAHSLISDCLLRQGKTEEAKLLKQKTDMLSSQTHGITFDGDIIVYTGLRFAVIIFTIKNMIINQPTYM